MGARENLCDLAIGPAKLLVDGGSEMGECRVFSMCEAVKLILEDDELSGGTPYNVAVSERFSSVVPPVHADAVYNECSLPKTYKLSDVSCFMSTLFPPLLQFLVRAYTSMAFGQHVG